MNISIFKEFGWKMPIQAPNIGIFMQFDPLNGLQYIRFNRIQYIGLLLFYSVIFQSSKFQSPGEGRNVTSAGWHAGNTV